MKYNYDKFLSDSSDDYPKLRAEENEELITCLNNVLTLASERLEQLTSPNYSEQDIDIADVSIRAIKSFLYKIKDSNIVLALDKGNK